MKHGTKIIKAGARVYYRHGELVGIGIVRFVDREKQEVDLFVGQNEKREDVVERFSLSSVWKVNDRT